MESVDFLFTHWIPRNLLPTIDTARTSASTSLIRISPLELSNQIPRPEDSKSRRQSRWQIPFRMAQLRQNYEILTHLSAKSTTPFCIHLYFTPGIGFSSTIAGKQSRFGVLILNILFWPRKNDSAPSGFQYFDGLKWRYALRDSVF